MNDPNQEPKETATNKEAQAAVSSGESEIPSEAAVSEDEVKNQVNPELIEELNAKVLSLEAEAEVLKNKLTSSEEYAKIVNGDADTLKTQNEALLVEIENLKAAKGSVSRPSDFPSALKVIHGGKLSGKEKRLAEQYYDHGYSDGAGK